MATDERLGRLEEWQRSINDKIDILDRNLSKRMDDTNQRVTERHQRLNTLDTKIDNPANRMDIKFDTLTSRTDSLNFRMTGIGILLAMAVIGAAATNIFFGHPPDTPREWVWGYVNMGSGA